MPPDPIAVNEEKRKVKAVLHLTETEVIYCQKFSSWKRLVRVTGYVFKSIQILKAKTQRGPPPDDAGTLSPAELNEAEKYWIKKAQKRLLPRFQKVVFKSLSPFMDKEGMVRVGG